ncbi:MAG: hypothetical protein V3W52_17190 [Syntrophobacteria bacterium]
MVGRAPQPDAREQRFQDKCRAIFPDHYVMHHCWERKTRFVKGVRKIPIGHLFVVFLSPEDHKLIHAHEGRRMMERTKFIGMLERLGVTDSELIRCEEINACLDYR